MSKYNFDNTIQIPQNKKEDVNSKILYLITNNLAKENGITKQDIFNSYSPKGAFHNIDFADYNNFHEYTEAKKEVTDGQYFTPPETCNFMVECIRPNNKDIIYDLCCGTGNFFNYLPVESNIYGTEIDAKACKVAKYLYPEANIVHEDIRQYKIPVKADIVFGNPPFSLNWEINNEKITSQMYYCLKSAEALKPGGLMAIIVPSSFLADEFSNKSDIEKINRDFNFLVQFDLSTDLFNSMGVNNFQTKIMFFQRKSKYLEDKEYTTSKEKINADSEYIYMNYIKPVLVQREKVSSKIYFESQNEDDTDKTFIFETNKLLFDIKRNKNTSNKHGLCVDYLNKFLTQKKPKDMPMDEWLKLKIKREDVISYLKNILKSANKIYKNEKKIVKRNYDFYLKDYSENAKHEKIKSINDCVLDNDYIEGYEKLIAKKRDSYLLHAKEFEDMIIDINIAKSLKEWTVYSKTNDKFISLIDVQSEDTNKLLQKNYGILQYSMGAGKTLCGLAMAQYKLKHSNIRNVFVVSTAIAINNTWEIVLDDYDIDFKRIKKLSDIYEIKEKQIVIITLDMVTKLKKHLKKYVKKLNQKAMLIFDESDAISSPYSKRTKAMLSVFRKLECKYLTTGTATRNNICEIATQLELMFNNSINYLSWCEYIFSRDKENDLVEEYNSYYRLPIPAYRKGYRLFSESHLPEKITVFGIGKMTQDIYNSDILKELIDKTIITKSFEQVIGKKIYEIKQIVVPFNDIEKNIYKKAIEEFEQMRRLYFAKQDNSRKDSMVKILQQLLLLLKVCANPSGIKGYNSNEMPTKVSETLEMLDEWKDERVAIGLRNVSVVKAYEKYIRNRFPNRPVFVIIGEETSFKQRRNIVAQLEKTNNGILISTQQALSASTSIDFVDKIILAQLHYNDAAMSQYYFRFIRLTSKNQKTVVFLTYENTIESNLLKMILAKEKLNLFMKNEILDDDEIYDKFGVDPSIINNLMSKEYDEDGKVYIRWGEQDIS